MSALRGILRLSVTRTSHALAGSSRSRAIVQTVRDAAIWNTETAAKVAITMSRASSFAAPVPIAAATVLPSDAA